MSLVNNNIKWIMMVTGLLTCSMILNTFAPQAGLMQSFGASTFAGGVDSQVAEIVVRNWGFLITLVGGMLIYAANKPPLRKFVL
ncbi:MAG: hypothetical protein AAF197_00465, partial [Pseudomonadota bacterium]